MNLEKLEKSFENACSNLDMKEMVKKAEKKNIYDRLYVDDIVGRLAILKTRFSLFISSDVFAYIVGIRILF